MPGCAHQENLLALFEWIQLPLPPFAEGGKLAPIYSDFLLFISHLVYTLASCVIMMALKPLVCLNPLFRVCSVIPGFPENKT